MDLSFYLTQAANLKQELDSMRPLNAEREARILQKFRLDWNYHSNHLEGGKLTYGETKALILFGLTAQGKPLQDHLETSGHDEAIKWLEEVVKGDYPLTEMFIRQLHELVLHQPYQKDAITNEGKLVKRTINIGQYKEVPNHVKTITGEIFYFATPEETPAKMHDLIQWYQSKAENPETNPIILAIDFHYKFIRIHPFDDGNGRLARLLMNFILMKVGYPPAIIKTEDKENYYAALRQADADILEPFAIYIAQNLIASLNLMIKGAKGEPIEEPDDLDKQIALLENKLKNVEVVIKKVKNTHTLIDWTNNVLPLILTNFVSIAEKMNRFYVSIGYNIEFPIKPFKSQLYPFENHDKNISLLINQVFDYILSNDITRCILKCDYKAFKKVENLEDSFDFQFWIGIKFEKLSYIIESYNANKSFTKFYHQTPTVEELNIILNAETQRHLAFIQEKINKEE